MDAVGLYLFNAIWAAFSVIISIATAVLMLSCLAAAAVCAIGAGMALKERAARRNSFPDWGKVIDAEVTVDDDGESTTYMPEIVFEHRFAGEIHRTDTRTQNWVRSSFGSRKAAEARLQDTVRGGRIQILVDRDDPSRAMIQRDEWAPKFAALAILGAVFLSAGAFMSLGPPGLDLIG
ncbi:MAG: DUF3592 domain-containing protein [Pseudomonadota bacterium]